MQWEKCRLIHGARGARQLVVVIEEHQPACDHEGSENAAGRAHAPVLVAIHVHEGEARKRYLQEAIREDSLHDDRVWDRLAHGLNARIPEVAHLVTITFVLEGNAGERVKEVDRDHAFPRDARELDSRPAFVYAEFRECGTHRRRAREANGVLENRGWDHAVSQNAR